MEMLNDYFGLIIGAIFINNILLAKFLGNCPFLGVSKKMEVIVTRHVISGVAAEVADDVVVTIDVTGEVEVASGGSEGVNGVAPPGASAKGHV